MEPFDFKSFGGFWKRECGKALNVDPTRVVLINTEYVAEGLNLLGVELVLGLSSYKTGNVMEQAFGRADRMCSQSLFRSKDSEPRKLQRRQYYIEDHIKNESGIHIPLSQWVSKEVQDDLLEHQSFKTK